MRPGLLIGLLLTISGYIAAWLLIYYAGVDLLFVMVAALISGAMMGIGLCVGVRF